MLRISARIMLQNIVDELYYQNARTWVKYCDAADEPLKYSA